MKTATTNDLLEILEFMQDHMATKEDLSDLEIKIDGKFAKLKYELLDKMDEKFLNFKGDMDERFTNFKNELIELHRKGDKRVLPLIGKLRENDILSKSDADEILAVQ